MIDESQSDPLAKMINAIVGDQKRQAEEHAAVRASDAYRGAIRQVDRYIIDYGLGINAIGLMASRRHAYFDELISLRMKPHLVQSMIAASHLIKEGLHDPARRELRFMVEASVKALWLDRGSPDIRPEPGKPPTLPPMTVSAKVGALDSLGRERFDQVVDSLTFGMLDDAGASCIGRRRKASTASYPRQRMCRRATSSRISPISRRASTSLSKRSPT